MKFIDPALENYAISKSNQPSQLADELELYTRENIEMSRMLIGKLEASLLGSLIKLNQAKRVLEFGTFTGYSALVMAESLPSDGEVITLDIDAQNGEIAQKFWNRSSHGHKIKQIIGSAQVSIKEISGNFDLVFIDADKTGYRNYLDFSLAHLNKNGIIVIDNVLWSGKVLNSTGDPDTQALQQINNFIAQNDQLFGTLLPIRDGIFLVQKD